MQSIRKYLSALTTQLGQKQVRKNVDDLSEKLIDHQTGKLWTISEDGTVTTRSCFALCLVTWT